MFLQVAGRNRSLASIRDHVVLILEISGVIGSLLDDTSLDILSSRIMKFVALVSSSMSNVEDPDSIASTILDACDVDPDASAEEKQDVDFPIGRLLMNNEIFTSVTHLPSSARIFIFTVSLHHKKSYSSWI